MQLILREGNYENQIIISEQATHKLISDSLRFIIDNVENTLELVSEDGGITTGFEPSLNGYFVNIMKKSPNSYEGFTVDPYIEKLSDLESLLNYYLDSDPRLENDFKWVIISNDYDSDIYDATLRVELHKIKLDYIVSMAEIYPKNSQDFTNLIAASEHMTPEELSIATDDLVKSISESYQFDSYVPFNIGETTNTFEKLNKNIQHPLSLPEHHIHGGSAFGIDRKNRLIIFGQQNGNNFDIEAFPYINIQSTEVLVNSDTYLKINRAGQIGGAIIGGALTGGIGALVMAMGAKKTNVEKIRKVELKIIVKGSPNPVKVYEFSDGIFSSSQKMVEEATRWNDLIRVLIAEADEVEHQPSQSSNQVSLADEIQKLLSLKNQGILTESEFTSAKQKLLS